MKPLRGKTEARALRAADAARYPEGAALSFLMQDWEDGYNVGGLLRLADGLGAFELFASGSTPVPPHPMIGVTSLGHHRRIPIHHHRRHEDAARAALEAGYSLVALEIAEGAQDYLEFAFPRRVCIAVGNEAKGLYKGVLSHCSGAVMIPMYGKGRSLNVVVSAGIVGYQAVASWRQQT